MARPDWHVRALWSVDDPPLRPLLALAEPQLDLAICEAAGEGARLLAEDYDFPSTADDDASAQIGLTYAPPAARALLDRAAGGPSRAPCCGARSCVTPRPRTTEWKPRQLCLLFGQGHQHFLGRLAAVPAAEAPPPRGRGRKAVSLSAPETLHEALFRPWERGILMRPSDGIPSEDVRYALRADDPSGEKSTTQHGANRLAALGRGVDGRSRAARGEAAPGYLGHDSSAAVSLHRPVWQHPTSLAGIRALLSHPALSESPAILAHLGVVEVRRARRVSVGKFMNFTRATPVVAAR